MSKPQVVAPAGDKFLTTKQAAAQLGVSLRTVQLWFDAGRIQGCTTFGSHRRIRQSEVDRLLASMTSEAGGLPTKAITADERVKDSAHDLLEALKYLLDAYTKLKSYEFDYPDEAGQLIEWEDDDAEIKARTAIEKATGSAA